MTIPPGLRGRERLFLSMATSIFVVAFLVASSLAGHAVGAFLCVAVAIGLSTLLAVVAIARDPGIRPVSRSDEVPAARADQLAESLPPAVVDVSVVIPCLNEAETVGVCVRKALEVMQVAGWSGEVVVVDSESTDWSVPAAQGAGARVVSDPARSYGSAVRTGFGVARGRYIIQGDASGSYDLAEVPSFVRRLMDGADLVIGDRPSRRLGSRRRTPLFRFLASIMFRIEVNDIMSWMLGVRREVLPQLHLQSSGFELTAEMIVKARRLGLHVEEIGIRYEKKKSPASRSPRPVRDRLRVAAALAYLWRHPHNVQVRA